MALYSAPAQWLKTTVLDDNNGIVNNTLTVLKNIMIMLLLGSH